MLDIFLISVIVVIIIDISGITDTIKSLIKRIITRGMMSDPNYSLKPIDCSFCMTFWTGLVYMLCVGTFSLWMVTYLLLLCVMTPVIKDVIILFRNTIIKIINKI